jgi:hypothetical protein
MDFQGIIGLLATAGCCFSHYDPFRRFSFSLWEQYPMSTANTSFVWGNLPVATGLLSHPENDGLGAAGGSGRNDSNSETGGSSTAALSPPANKGPLYSVGRQAASMLDAQQAYVAMDTATEKFMQAAVRAYVGCARRRGCDDGGNGRARASRKGKLWGWG